MPEPQRESDISHFCLANVIKFVKLCMVIRLQIAYQALKKSALILTIKALFILKFYGIYSFMSWNSTFDASIGIEL